MAVSKIDNGLQDQINDLNSKIRYFTLNLKDLDVNITGTPDIANGKWLYASKDLMNAGYIQSNERIISVQYTGQYREYVRLDVASGTSIALESQKAVNWNSYPNDALFIVVCKF